MRKLASIIGLAAMMSLSTEPSTEFKITKNPDPKKPTSKNKPSKGRWRSSPTSEYFGRRSKVVTAITPKGPQKMKLKNALKKDFQFNF